MMTLLPILFAQVYGAGGYNTSTYEGGSNAGPSVSSSLSNTGIAIATIVTIAVLILLVALVIRIMRRPNKQAVPVENDDTLDTINR